MRHWITSAILFASLLASQQLAAQSNVAFAPEVYQAHRAGLIREIGDDAAIIPSRHLVGEVSWGAIRMNPDFWYLTGVETVYSVLVVTKNRTALFVPTEQQFRSGQFPTADFDAFRTTFGRTLPVR